MTGHHTRSRKRHTRPQRPTGRIATIRQFRKASPAQRLRWTLAVNAIAKMRTDRLSLPKAARAVGTDAKTVKQLAGSALRKDRRGRHVATKSDTLLRVLSLPTARGTREVAVKNSRTASLIGKYFEAIRRYIHTDNADALKPFRQLKLMDARGTRIALLTDLAALKQLGHAGVLSFESLYARTE